MSRLVVVSNRIAPPDNKGGAGGLAVGVLGALKAAGGLWFGWSGETGNEDEPLKKVTKGNITWASFNLSEQDYEDYYCQFSNAVLWPAFHYRLDLVQFQRPAWEGYMRVNALLADKLLPLIKENDIIWVHDYHLLPFASELRKRGVNNRIGFFLHIILLGYLVVIGTVFGGYVMTGGHLGALYQPAELVIIGGAGIGAFIVGNNGKAIKGTMKAIPLLFRRSKYTKSMYMDLLALLYRLMAKSRQQGMFSLERDIENPKESEIFASYPRILADAVMLDFIVDYLRLIISGNMNTFEIEALMDEEIETHESEAEVPANSLAMVGDSLPAFGIVAAVMGVVHALASADRPAAELGALIAHAMVGTFLGILLAYGFISPLATVLRQKSAETTKMMQCVKITLLSNLNGYAPPIAVEFGRKTLYSSERPSFIELEEHVRAVRNPNQQQTTEEA